MFKYKVKKEILEWLDNKAMKQIKEEIEELRENIKNDPILKLMKFKGHRFFEGFVNILCETSKQEAKAIKKRKGIIVCSLLDEFNEKWKK